MSSTHRLLSAPPRRGRYIPPNVATPRDSEANSQLQIALSERGYKFGRTILNYPGEEQRYELLPPTQLQNVDLPFLEEGDALTWTTRPPLSDGWHGDNKKVEAANTTLESMILKLYRRYFTICARSHLLLTEEAASWLPSDKLNREELFFFQHGCAYQFLQQKGKERSGRKPLGLRTAAFLFRVDEIWPGGPGIFCAWGMDAIATLGWCRLLRYRYSDLLSRRGLTMVEIAFTPKPDRPLTYDWTDDWSVEEIFSTPSELPPRPDESYYAISL